MKQINLAIIGTGWIGGLRAIAAANSGHVKNLYIAEPNEARAKEVAAQTNATRWVTDYRDLLDEDIDAVIITATPETTHYPIAKEWLNSKRHVLLEKPMSITLEEADELIDLYQKQGVKFTIGYTQRFNPKFAYAKQNIENGTLGRPVSALISRHIARTLGAKIAGRGDLGPVKMEGTHDIDLVLWWMSPAKPIRVYAQAAQGVMREQFGLPDSVWTMVTLDNETAFTIGSSWNLPPEAPGFAGTTVELICTDGAMFIDETRRDLLLTTVKDGITRPMSSMPGEQVGHVYAGPMEAETRYFIDCVVKDLPVLVTPEQARQVMEVTFAADISTKTGKPVDLPLARTQPVVS